jgi:hypothetical protein
MEDTGMENCLSKTKFTSAEGCAGTWAQQAQRVDHRSAFLFLTKLGSALFTQIGQVHGHNLIMIGQWYTWNLGVG